MPLYAELITWTDQGARAAKDSVKRYEALAGMAQSLGAKIQNVWWTMGQYDAVAILDAPDDATASRFAIAAGSQGNIRTVTMRAYTKEEMSKILAALP